MSELKKVFIDKNNVALQFVPFNQTRTYGLRCQNFENDKIVSQIHFEIDVASVQSYTNDTFNFEINRKQIYIDNLAPDLKIEQIAESCSQALFPIKLKVNSENEIIQIINHEEIKDRWLPIKEKISNYYVGKLVPELLQKMESILHNEILLKESICKTWFFHCYFQPLYSTYNKREPINYICKSPVFGNQTIKYAVQQSIEEYYSATDKIFINVKGNSADERSIQEVLDKISYPKSKMTGAKFDPLQSEMSVQYKLYGEDFSVFSIIGTYKTLITERSNKTTKIEIYHLPENSSFRPHTQSNESKVSFWIDDTEEEVVKKKTGFWGNFF